jgi:branched-chain amino acid transport system substrate-binding protein
MAADQGKRRRRLAALLVALVPFVLASCGSRLSNDQLTSAEHHSIVYLPDGTATTAPGVSGPTTIPSTASTSPATGGGSHRGGSGPGPTNPGTSTTGPVVGSGGPQPSTPTSGGPSTGTGSAPQQCTKALPPINIGTVGEYSGIFGPIFGPMAQTVQAWATAMNANGGLGCHPIHYFVEDDGGDPSVDQSEVQTLVEQDHVIALVQESAPLAGAASVDYLQSHHVPVIGSEGGSNWFNTSPDFFPQASSGLAVFKAFVAADAVYGIPLHKTKWASVSCIEAALCSKLYSLAPALAKSVGLNLVYRGQASLTAPDFTANCQAAKKAGAQILFVGLDTNSIERLMANCASVGYHPTFSTGGSLATPALLKFKLAQGSVFTSATVPFVNTSNPQVRAMDQVLRQYAPGIPASAASMAGWISAQIFAKAAQHLSATPTSADILNGLWGIKHDDFDGSTYPLTYIKNQPAPGHTCFWVTQAEHGTYVDVGTGKLQCV